MKGTSLSLRLALWVGLAGASLVLILSCFNYWVLSTRLESSAQQTLQAQLQLVQQILAAEPNARRVSRLTRLFDPMIANRRLNLVVTADGGASVLASYGNHALDSIRTLAQTRERPAFVPWRAQDNTELLTLVGSSTLQDGQVLTILLTLNRSEDGQLLSAFAKAMWAASPLALALVAVGALWISRRGLAPLSDLRRVASAVSTKNLSARLAVTDLPDELRDVGESFNQMLERINEGVSRLSQFSGDLAHELRTPLTNLLGKTQVTLSQVRTSDTYRAALEANVEEFERLARLITDMLFLAHADSAQAALKLEDFDVGVEAVRVAEFFELAAQEHDVSIRVKGAARVRADRSMIQRALSNLVSNAVRYTRAGGCIEVDITIVASERVEIAVRNPGSPIAPEQFERLFDRFYRADEGRSRDEGGSGLGLSIVKSIMALHAGVVTADSRDGATTFRLSLPVSGGSSAPHACARQDAARAALHHPARGP